MLVHLLDVWYQLHYNKEVIAEGPGTSLSQEAHSLKLPNNMTTFIEYNIIVKISLDLQINKADVMWAYMYHYWIQLYSVALLKNYGQTN